jgi:hypothetical protein
MLEDLVDSEDPKMLRLNFNEAQKVYLEYGMADTVKKLIKVIV